MIKQILGKLPRKPSSKIPSVSDPATTTTSYSSEDNSDDGRFAAILAQPLHAPNSTSVSKNPSQVSSSAAKPSNLGPGASTANTSNQAKKSSVLATAGLVMSNNGNTSDLASPLPACIPAYEALPSFRDVPNSEKQSLFLKKINMCYVVFDFSVPSRNLKEKDVKRQTLLELVDYVTSVTAKFSEVAMQEITRMVAANLFRTFPPSNHDSKHLDTYDPEEEEPAMEPAWSHLQIVYEFLLRFVASPEMDAKIAKRYIDHSFVLRLLDLFDSEDQREREYLKTILHRIYGKFMVHRPFIRKATNSIFYRFIFETEKHNGIAELLEILGSIINGFALPLKEEHKLFLVRALIPLHKPKCVAAYHQQLSYCIIQFVEKDFKLADTVIRGVLKYWPITNSSKEVMFLGELEEILEVTQVAEFQRCMVPLFRLIARCLNSSHFQVAERTLFLWNNDHIRNLIIQNRKVILPIIFAAMEKNTKGHWNQAVQSLTLNVRKLFVDADQEFFEDCLLRFQEGDLKERVARERRESSWKRLEDLAASKAVASEAVLVTRTFSGLSIATTSPPPVAGP